MVDLAFLLVTFFMLTAQFRPEESVTVDTPSSMSQLPIPNENLMTVVVDSTGKIFWDMTDKQVRMAVLDELGKRIGYTPSAEDKVKFASLGAIGVPLEQLPAFLALHTADERNALTRRFDGIPVDSANNQLRDWVYATTRLFREETGKDPVVALKADGNTYYDQVNKVIKTFQKEPVEIHKFRMITDLEESRL